MSYLVMQRVERLSV